MPSIASLAAALLLAAPCAAADERLDALVERLASPLAAERSTAERELGQSLQPDDLGPLAERIDGAGPEVRLRIAAALGARDEHLGLAAGLAADLRRAPREVGEWAIAAAVGRWKPGLAAQPLRGGTLLETLDRLLARQRRAEFRFEGRLGLVAGLDALMAGAQPAVAVVVDPALRGTPGADPGAWPTITGTWRGLLEDLIMARAIGLDAAFYVVDGQPELANIAYVRVTRPELEGIDPPDAQLARWLRDAQSRVGPVAARAARALGESGWPAALDWLGGRWVERADPVALAGLVAAARRGYLPPDLLDPGRYGQLCAALRARCEAGPAALPTGGGGAVDDDPLAHVELEAVAEALAQCGARLSDGSSAVAALMRGVGVSAPRWSWLAVGCAGSIGVPDPALVAAAGELLSHPLGDLDDPAAAELTARVLEAWAGAIGDEPPAPTPARSRALLAHLGGLEEARSVLRSLRRSGVAAPSDLALGGLPPLARATYAAWLVSDGRLDLGPPALSNELAELDPLSRSGRDRRLSDLAVLLGDVALDRPGAVDGALELVRADPAAERVASELAARSGRLEPAAHGRVLQAAIDRLGLATVDVALLADLGTGPAGARAQDLLVARLEDEVADPGLHDAALIDGLARVIRALLSAERDLEALALRTRVRRVVRADRETPAARAVLVRDWPGMPALQPTTLEAPRRLPAELRPAPAAGAAARPGGGR